jgi:uncharacterized protein (DUF1501 family)
MEPGFGLHHSLARLYEMRDTRLAIINGVGYENFNRSHFKASDILR